MPSRGSPDQTPGLCEICGDDTGAWHLLNGGRLDQCRSCGHVTRSLRDCPANHRADAYGGDPALDRTRLMLTYRALAARGVPDSVFEIGYGDGALLRRFLEAGARIGGVDPGQLGATVDAEVLRRGTLWQGVMEDLPDGSYQADLVYGVHVIEHVTDPMRTMRKASTLLKEGGRLTLLTPAADSWGLRTFGAAWWMLEDPTHVRFFTESSLALAARSAGFGSIRVERLVMDSLTCDVASAARLLRTTGSAGVLADRGVMGVAVATAPLVAVLRLAWPRSRATLRLTAECVSR